MHIDEKLLSKLEKLSALKIETQRRSEIICELSEIVAFVNQLNELDLSSCEATINTIKGGTPLRIDEVNNSDIAQGVLNNAPKSIDRFFIVPKIIE